MTLSQSNPRAKPRWLLLAALVVTLTVIVSATALATHEQTFQLDGDTSTTDINPLPGVTRDVDWDSLYDATGAVRGTLPEGYAPGELARDFRIVQSGSKAGRFDTSDGTTFTGGSKDTLDINEWRCVGSNNVTQKGDITNAYATLYTNEADERFLYFGMEKYAPQGTNNVGVWFLQDDEVGCAEDGSGNGNPFSGMHRNGDLFVVSAFSNGGAVSTILAYEWLDGALSLLTPTAGVDCRATTAGDDICGAANQAAIAIAWPHASNADGSNGQAGSANQPPATFFEGGIKLSEFPQLANRCFSKFLFNTRASTSPTATIYDYALGQLGECETTVSTTPQTFDDEADDYADVDGPISIGTGSALVRDTAGISVDGIDTWSGTLSFHLCGPTDADEDYVLCAEDGTEVSTHPVSQATPQPIASDAVTVTSAGKYCWRGHFEPDTATAAAGVEAGTDATEGECFTVAPVTPTLSTTAWSSDGSEETPGSAQTDPVAFGDPIYDRADLDGTASQPGDPIIDGPLGDPAAGTITFTLMNDDCEAVDVTSGDNPQTVSVSGDGDYYTAAVVPAAPGTYHWQAKYNGNEPNTLASALHNEECDVLAETVVVQQLQPTMDTAQSFVPNDSATISVEAGAGDLSGSVWFYLFVDDALCGAEEAGGAIDLGAGIRFGGDDGFAVFAEDDGSTDPLTDTVDSDNETAYTDNGDNPKTFHWVVVFESDNGAHLGVTSPCGNEHSSINVDDGVTQPAAEPEE